MGPAVRQRRLMWWTVTGGAASLSITEYAVLRAVHLPALALVCTVSSNLNQLPVRWAHFYHTHRGQKLIETKKMMQ